MRGKKVLAALLAAAMSATLIACGGNETQPKGETVTDSGAASQAKEGDQNSQTVNTDEIDTTEFVKIKALFIGDQQPDAELVYDYVNEKLREYCNAELEVEMIPWGDMATTIPLILSAQEEYDLIPTSTDLNYFENASDGVFMEISDEVLQKYMPLTWENQDHNHFRGWDVSGKCYAVPINFPGYTFAYAVALRTDLLEKYNMEMPASWEELEAFYDMILEKEEGMLPLAFGSVDGIDAMNILYYEKYNMNYVNSLKEYMAFPYTGEDVGVEDVVCLLDDPNYIAALHKVKECADKGYWSKNANVNPTSIRDAFESGASASMIQNIGTASLSSITINNNGKGWKADLTTLNPDTVRSFNIPEGGLAVPAWAPNAERALMVLDYLKFDKDIYQAMRYGIKGTHWEPNEDETKWIPLDQTGYVFGNGNSWQFKNEFLPYELDRADQLDSYIEMVGSWRKDLKANPNIAAFNFDTTNVASEMANMNNVVMKYKPQLHYGLVEDVDATVAEYRKALNAAGFEKVYEEFKRQLQEYLDQR